MITRTIAATARTTPNLNARLSGFCVMSASWRQMWLGRILVRGTGRDVEMCEPRQRCFGEIGQGWQPAVPSSFHFNCRLFWRTGGATAGLFGARLKTLSASRGKRGWKRAVSPSSTTAGATCALGRRIDVATGVVPHTRHPADGRRCRPTQCSPRRSRSRSFPKTINSPLAAGAAGTARRSPSSFV
jgi:hypothetical protein